MLLWITEHLEGQGWQELCQDRACVLRAAFCFWRPLDSSCGWWTHHCQACWDGHCSVYCKRGRRTRALSPGQEARGLSCREAQPGSQACSSSEACAGVSPCSLAAPPEPRAGKGSALPQRERGCPSGPWAPVLLCSPPLRMAVTQHPCVSSRLLCYIKSCLSLTGQSGCVFFLCCMYCVTAASPLNFWLHPGNFLCPSHQCVLYPILGALACSGSGKMCWADFTFWCKDARRGRAWPPASCVFSAGSVN